MATDEDSPFAHGSAWVRADFHLHTKADKEFKYSGDENAFVGAYVDALKKAGIGLAVVTNHNKFDAGEFKALRKRASKDGIGVFREDRLLHRGIACLVRSNVEQCSSRQTVTSGWL